jgi:transcriptional regulator with GAF, ATPase, and Fis domain
MTLGPDVLDVGSTEQPAVEAAPEQQRVPTLDEVQATHIREVLSLTGGRLYGKGGAAQLLGLKPSTLQSRMQKLGVPRVKEGGEGRQQAASAPQPSRA